MSELMIKKIDDNKQGIKRFQEDIDNDRVSKYLSEYPVVYIHNWKNKQYEVYIGEANDIVRRTKQHLKGKKTWQKGLSRNKAQLYIIGDKYFNKSMTLDLENRLMHYMLGVDCIKKIHNARGNPQSSYYDNSKADKVFKKVWEELGEYDKELFPDEEQIRDSAIFKASPLHELNNEQIEAKRIILEKIEKASEKTKRGNIVFIQGEAGTGKTVLNSSVFYDLYCENREKETKFNSVMLVNHSEQLKVYNQIAKKLGMQTKQNDVVKTPTSFIHQTSTRKPVDVAFVDEAHLLLTQSNRGYRGGNHLEDIRDRAKVVVIMFDENQILRTDQYWEAKEIKKYKKMAKDKNTYIELTEQMRIQAEDEVVDWIDTFTKEQEIKKLEKSNRKYDIQICDSPREVERLIKDKAAREDSSLSRMIATYDWEYVDKEKNKKRQNDRFANYWVVEIGNWVKPWNYQISKNTDKETDSELAWAEQKETINEVGSTFTIQGFDLSYSGVILGPSVTYRDGKIVFDRTKSYNKKAIQNRTYSDKDVRNFADELLQHEVRVLMTRGVKGLYIYACDDELQNALKEAIE